MRQVNAPSIAVTPREQQQLLRSAIANAGGLRAFARAHRISPTHVSRAAASAEPLAGKLLEALGLELVVYVRRKEADRG